MFNRYKFLVLPAKRLSMLVFVLILLFGVGVRFFLADTQARCSHDAYFSILDEHGFPTWRMESNGYLHYKQDLYLKLLFPPSTNLEIRILPLVYGSLSLPLAFWLGYLLKGRRGGLWALFLLAINIAHLGITAQDRFYACGLFFAILSTGCLLKSSQGRFWRAAHIASLGCAILAMITNIFLFWPHILCLRKQPRTQGNILHQLATFITTAVSFLFLQVREMRSTTNFGYEMPPFLVLDSVFKSWINGGTDFNMRPIGVVSYNIDTPYLSLWLGVTAVLVGLYCWYKHSTHPQRQYLIALAQGGLISIILELGYSLFRSNIMSFCTLLWSLPIALILLSAFLSYSRYASQIFLLGLLAMPPQSSLCTYVYSCGIDQSCELLSNYWRPRDTIFTTATEILNSREYFRERLQASLPAPIAPNHHIQDLAETERMPVILAKLQHSHILNPRFSRRMFIIDYGSIVPPPFAVACELTKQNMVIFGDPRHDPSSRIYMISFGD